MRIHNVAKAQKDQGECPWDERQVRTFVRNAQASVGGLKGWHAIGQFLQRALLEAYTARVIASQLDDATIYPPHVRSLYRAMLHEAGLEDE